MIAAIIPEHSIARKGITIMRKLILGTLAALILIVIPELITVTVTVDATVTPLPSIGRCV